MDIMIDKKDMEEFAQMVAQEQDSGKRGVGVPMSEVEERTKEAASKIKDPKMTINKPFGKAGFGQGEVGTAPYYLKELQRNRILKKLDIILKGVKEIRRIVNTLEEKLIGLGGKNK
jgi:hypothetical protein